MEIYLRFETPFRCAHHGRPLGVFHAVSSFRHRANLPEWADEVLEQTLGWFNSNLPVPKSEELDRRAIFWFSRQSEAVREMWQLVSLFREEGVPVRMRRTDMPGRIVYRDDLQIAAIPYGHGLRCRSREF